MNNNGISAAERAASEEFGNRMLKYPIEEQIAVGLISANILNGCSWEFTRNNIDVKKNMGAFNKSQSCNAVKVGNGYLVTMSMGRIVQILEKEAMGIFNAKDLQLAQQHRKEALVELDKKLRSGYQGMMGIFCTNDSTSITIDGNRYPAYAVTLQELLTVCIRNGYGVVCDQLRKPQEVAAQSTKVIERLHMAPSGNALLITVKKLK